MLDLVYATYDGKDYWFDVIDYKFYPGYPSVSFDDPGELSHVEGLKVVLKGDCFEIFKDDVNRIIEENDLRWYFDEQIIDYEEGGR